MVIRRGAMCRAQSSSAVAAGPGPSEPTAQRPSHVDHGGCGLALLVETSTATEARGSSSSVRSMHLPVGEKGFSINRMTTGHFRTPVECKPVFSGKAPALDLQAETPSGDIVFPERVTYSWLKG